MRAWANIDGSLANGDPGSRDQALSDAMRALAIDPDSVLALCTLAYVQWNRVFFKSADDPQTALLQGIAAAKRAIELNLNDVAPYIAMGLVQQTAGAAKQAITLLQQALRICPKGHYHFYYYYPVGPR